VPYIKQEDRPEIDRLVADLSAHLKTKDEKSIDGNVNYAVTKLLKELYPPEYYNYNRAIGVMSCIQAEFYRRDVAPYEDIKIEENGDVV